MSWSSTWIRLELVLTWSSLSQSWWAKNFRKFKTGPSPFIWFFIHNALHFELKNIPTKKSKNKFRPGGNNTVGLHHPHLCSSTNLGESNTDCSQSRLCAYGTTTVCLKKWQYQWWENDNGLMLIRRHQTHKKTKTTRKAKRQRHLENTSKVIPETCDQALTRVKKVWE